MEQDLIDELINCLKMIEDNVSIFNLPSKGFQDSIDLKSHSHYFLVDINRKGRKKPQFTLQLRNKSYKDFPLLRLDIIGPPHPNPEGDFPYAGESIPCPHIHIANEKYATKIAYPLNEEYAKMYLTDDQLSDLIETLKEFLKYCNVGNINTVKFLAQNELF